MGEQTEFAGLGKGFFSCRQEDIGTEKRKWHKAELKSMDSLSVRSATEVPEIGVKEPRGFSNTITINLEPSEETKQNLIRFHRKIKKFYRGRRYYRKKLLRHVSKKTLRRYCYYLRKYASYVRKEKQP